MTGGPSAYYLIGWDDLGWVRYAERCHTAYEAVDKLRRWRGQFELKQMVLRIYGVCEVR